MYICSRCKVDRNNYLGNPPNNPNHCPVCWYVLNKFMAKKINGECIPYDRKTRSLETEQRAEYTSSIRHPILKKYTGKQVMGWIDGTGNYAAELWIDRWTRYVELEESLVKYYAS